MPVAESLRRDTAKVGHRHYYLTQRIQVTDLTFDATGYLITMGACTMTAANNVFIKVNTRVEVADRIRLGIRSRVAMAGGVLISKIRR